MEEAQQMKEYVEGVGRDEEWVKEARRLADVAGETRGEPADTELLWAQLTSSLVSGWLEL
jgi:hypothetical protein